MKVAVITGASAGLGEELADRGITSTAVCSGPMDTEFIYPGGIKGHSGTFDTLPYCDPKRWHGAHSRRQSGADVCILPTRSTSCTV